MLNNVKKGDFIEFGKDVLRIVSYDSADSFRNMRREQVLDELVSLADAYGFESLGAGQNRYVVALDAKNVVKIAFRGYGVQDNIGEYKFTEYCVRQNAIEILNMVTHCQLNFTNSAFNEIYNPLRNGGLMVIQKRISGLKELANNMQAKGVNNTLSGIAKEILDMPKHLQRYKYMMGVLAPHCFLFDLGRDKPFNFGLDEGGVLRILDYGYIRLIHNIDAEAGKPAGTFTLMESGAHRLKCMDPMCNKSGVMLAPALYPLENDVDTYVCQKCKNEMSSLMLKDIYGI